MKLGPEYDSAFRELDDLVKTYQRHRIKMHSIEESTQKQAEIDTFFTVGMMVGKLLDIYKLGEPGGITDVEQEIRRGFGIE